jgi:hypothetical protein
LLYIIVPAVRSDELPSAAELATKIVRKLGGPAVATVQARNVSSLSSEQAAEARRALERELRRRRVRLGSPNALVAITVTFSENRFGAVWVAEIKRGDAVDIVIESGSLPPPKPSKAEPRVSLEKTRLWEQDGQILDVAALENDMLILSPGGLRHVWKTADQWNEGVLLPLSMPRPWPRDLRGRVEVAGDAVRVRLPGFSCDGTLERPVKLECQDRSEKWPALRDAEMVPGRNYFAAKDLPPFFSGARLDDKGRDTLAVAAVDGRLYLYSGDTGQPAVIDGWDGDIVAVGNACGGAWLILRAGAGEDRDAVQAFEIANRRPAALDRPLELPGLITAFWPASTGDKPVAVIHDPAAQRYAAYSLSVTCSH